MLLARPLYATDGTARVLYYALLTLWIGGELAILMRSLPRRDAQRRDRGSFLVVFASIFVGFALGSAMVSAVPAAAVGGARSTVFFLGTAVMAIGIALRFYAVAVLGRFFTFVVMVGGDQHIVKTGPYRWVRHPSYTGSLLTVTGALLAATNWAALVGVLPVLVGLLYRIRVEERALSDEFGEVYRSYARRTKRLVPFVY